MFGTRRIGWGSGRRAVIVGVTAVLTVTMAMFVPPVAAVAGGDSQEDPNWRAKRLAMWPELPKTPSVPGYNHKPSASAEQRGTQSATVKAVRWPAAGATTVSVPGGKPVATAPQPYGEAAPGGLPVRLSRPVGATDASAANAKVQVFDQAAAKAAGLTGVLLQVTAADADDRGQVQLSVDYSSFAEGSGGDWASRLRLVRLPECAARTPQLRECQTATPVKSVNNLQQHTVSASVALTGAPTADVSGRTGRLLAAEDGAAPAGGVMLALQAATSGANGDWSATPLAASATWQVSAQTGDFSWAYPLRTPPSVGGPAPALGLSYSSGSVDGRVASTNNQSSWIGDGWDMNPGSVERKYVSCVGDDTTGANNIGHETGDLCWKSDNATLSLNGQASELVKDEDTGKWRLKNDDGSKVERFNTGWNSDNDKEYWKVTTSDGTQYFFGRGQRSQTDTTALNSAWTVPVFGNHVNEPGYAVGDFAASWRNQAWKWNLDYVVDPHGNTMTYVYTPETNYYGRNRNTAVSPYTRGGFLSTIEYGERSGSEASTTAPMRVEFGVVERCLSNCATLDASTKANWPDVPYDQICSSTTSCPNVMSPAFFTRKRLTSVKTRVYNGSAYDDVESWTLAHSFPDPGDGESDPVLWLDSILHQGLRGGTAVTLPTVTFAKVQMANRVDAAGDVATAMIRYRIQSISSETGGRITINYDPVDCTPASLPSSPESNTRRCMPVYWTPEGFQNPIREYFHRYRVDNVVADPYAYLIASRDPMVTTDYVYVDAPAWHYDDNELIQPKHRTWSEFRGYGTVDVLTGDAGDQSKVRHRFFRGMDEDDLPGGGKRQVTVDGIDDHERYAGFTREQITYNGAAGVEISATVNTPWLSAATATGVDGTKAHFLNTGIVETRTAAPALPGAVRNTKIVTAFDDMYGMATQVDDRGDTATDADDLCTRYEYARDTTVDLTIVGAVARTETVSAACATAPQRPGDVVSDERSFYDGGAFGAAPTRGLVTKVEQVRSFTGSTPNYGAPAATTTYDAQGRIASVTDALGRTTTTSLTPSSGGPLTKMKVTTPDPDGTGVLTSHEVTTDLDPAFGVPKKVTDANNKVTEAAYDALGRLVKAWLPGRTTAQTPNLEYGYLLRTDAPNAIVTKTLIHDGTQIASLELFDGLLRPRQTQAAAAGEGGRVITDTRYDARGQAWRVNHAYKDTAAVDPANAPLFIPSTSVPGRTEYRFDGTGRVTDEIFFKGVTEAWRTVTSYGGDRVTVDPPTGGTPTTTISDARGRTTQLRQYLSGSPTGSHQDTVYSYDHAGRIEAVTDPALNRWSYGYDLLGRQTSAIDPDKGTTNSTYDDAGQLKSTTDVGRNLKLAYKYDNLGRRIELRDTNDTGALRAKWTYDTLAEGELTSSTRYSGTAAYTTAITAYDDGYRPLGHKVTLPTTGMPADEGVIGGDYTTDYTYTIDGQLKTLKHYATANLGAETVTTYYDTVGMPDFMGGGLGWGAYVAGSNWSAYGQLTFLDLGNTYFYHLKQGFEESTKRLKTSELVRQNASGADRLATYDYDAAGNVLSVIDRPAGQAVDAQCFRYPDDQLRRMTEAWTPANADCTPNPSVAALGGPAPYWNSYEFTGAAGMTGSRTKETLHALGGDTSRTYTYPAQGGARPHAVTQVYETGPGGDKTYKYDYDSAGNMTCRPAGTASNTCTQPTTGSQGLAWDAEEHLTSVTSGGQTSTYVYTADGERLLRREAGETTVYLPGGQELRLTVATGVKTAQRYYTFAGQTVAVRTGTGLAGVSTLIADHHGTAEISITNTTNTLARRRHDPYGNARPRGSTPAWPGDHGFLDKPKDANGLTHIGAREYDPLIGKFVSVDPIMDLGDPQHWNGYAYSNNNPVTLSDPTGLDPCPGGGHGCYYDGTTSDRDGVTSEQHEQGLAESKLEVTSLGLTGKPFKKLPANLQRRVEEMSFCENNPEVCAEYGCTPGADLQRSSSCAAAMNPQGYGPLEGLLVVAVQAGFGLFYVSIFTRTGFGIVFGVGGKGRGKNDGCNSFDPNTPVLLADGTAKKIKDIEVGDQVLATDPDTGQTAAKAVTQLHLNQDRQLTLVTVVDESGARRVIDTTWEHPFWSATRQEWVAAAELRAGEVLRTHSGTPVTVAKVDNYIGSKAMHNLTVADIHTYYVLAGDTPVLVHNDNGPSGVIARGPKGMSISIYANDHWPPHAHLKGNGFDIRIGQNGKPVNKGVVLTSAQEKFVKDNLKTLRNSMRAKMAEYNKNHPKDPVTGKRTGC
ncbi:polymorphic toxin-type HINT domain-containing protein [Catellatospora sp. NPDC049111]|uniref:polymorphic toxin-type HINT domain-containing protein n=1 Tax=Catellatospora sp. NPDC049111 TaxID=3155271 RepID=UPI0033DB6189